MKLLLKNIGQLARVSGFAAKKGKEMGEVEYLNDAFLLVEDEKIADFGFMKDLPKLSNCEVLDCEGKAVLPAFVDSHTHLVFGGFRADEFNARLSGRGYMEIMNSGGGIQSTTNATKKATEEELQIAAKNRLDIALEYGVTTMECKSGYGLDKDTELKQLRVAKMLDKTHPIDIVSTFMGAHAIPKGANADEYLDFVIEQMLPLVKNQNLAEFCDIFCEPNVFNLAQTKRFLEAAKKVGLASKVHADEIVNIGASRLAAEFGCVSADHLLQSNAEDIAALAKSDTIATLLPLTAFCLREPYANARAMIDGGCAVALATDLNPGSCFCQSIPLLIAIAAIHMKMTVEEILTALTLNAAAALGLQKQTGSIDKGKLADIIILKWSSAAFLPYHTATSSVETVIKRGRIVLKKEN